MDSLMGRESTSCDKEATTRNVADALRSLTNLATVLHQVTVDACDSICCSVDETFSKVIF